MIDVTPYARIPFVEDGRDIDGCDCYGLVRLVLKTEFDIDLPDYLDTPAGDAKRVARKIWSEKQAWTIMPPEWAKAGDVVLMTALHADGRVPWHMGLMVDTEHVMHIQAEQVHPIVQRLDALENRNPEIRRHAG